MTGSHTPIMAARLADAAAAISRQEKRRRPWNWFCIRKFPWVSGAQANNPWLLEFPDPISRATWDNYAIVSPKSAKRTWGIDLAIIARPINMKYTLKGKSSN